MRRTVSSSRWNRPRRRNLCDLSFLRLVCRYLPTPSTFPKVPISLRIRWGCSHPKSRRSHVKSRRLDRKSRRSFLNPLSSTLRHRCAPNPLLVDGVSSSRSRHLCARGRSLWRRLAPCGGSRLLHASRWPHRFAGCVFPSGTFVPGISRSGVLPVYTFRRGVVRSGVWRSRVSRRGGRTWHGLFRRRVHL